MKQNLIYSRNSDNSALTLTDIWFRAPSVLTQNDHADGLSSRYGEISSMQAIEMMRDYGWHPVQALQKKPRKNENLPYASHMVAFSNPAMPVIDGDGRPEVILYNSHDGSSSLKLFAGFYRFVCSNGIIAGSGFEGRVRHTINGRSAFESMLADTLDRVPDMLGLIDKLKGIRVSRDQIITLATSALSLRWQELPIDGRPINEIESGAYFDPVSIDCTIKPIRIEDTLPDAWTVFNRIQESVTRGKTMVTSLQVKDDTVRVKRRLARPVASVSEIVRVNRGLWNLARDVVEV